MGWKDSLSKLLTKPVMELLEKAGYEPAQAAKGLKAIAEDPLTERFFYTLNPHDLDYTAALNSPRALDNAKFIMNEGLPVSPYFRVWNRNSVLHEPSIAPVYTQDGPPIMMPDMVLHGSHSKGHQILESGHSRYGEGDTGVWGSIGKGSNERARSYKNNGPNGEPANGEVIPLWVRLENPFITDAEFRSWRDISPAKVLSYAGLKQPVKYDKATNQEMAALLEDYYRKEMMYGDRLGELRKAMKVAREAALKGGDAYSHFSGDPEGMLTFARTGDINSPLITNKDAIHEYRRLADEFDNTRSLYNDSINNFDDIAEKYFLYSDPDIESTLYHNRMRPNLRETHAVAGALKKNYSDLIDGTIMHNVSDGGYADNFATNVTWHDANQSKHAVENNGLFSPFDDRIRYAFFPPVTLEGIDSLSDIMSDLDTY